MNGQGRQAVGDDDGQIDTAGIGRCEIAQGLRRCITQFSPQVGALQVTVTVRCRAVQQQAFPSARRQLRTERGMVERQVHRIPGLGVGVLEIQLRMGGHAGAGAAQGDPRGRQAAQLQQRVLLINRWFIHYNTHPSCAMA
ncbi:hypothetical protein D3C87_1713280 [compost metagenome]